MPKLYVAYRTDGAAPSTLASGSLTTLKTKIREAGESTWTFATYTIKPDVPTLCQMIMDFSEVEADSVESYEVTASGRVRQTDG